MRTRIVAAIVFAFAGGFFSLSPAFAQADFPTKPIQLIVPFPGGGSSGLVSTTIAEKMSQVLGQPVVAVNKPGGATSVGSVAVATAKPDGYTILMNAGATITLPLTMKDAPYKLSDLTAICRIASNDRVRRHIGHDYRARGNDCAIADLYAGHNEAVIPYPDVVSNDGVTFVRKVIGLGHDLFPPVAENLEWISGNTGNLVVCAVHDELDATGYRAKLSDDQTVTNERKVVKDITFKVLRIFWIVVVGVIPNDDIRIRNGVLDEAYLRESRHRVLV